MIEGDLALSLNEIETLAGKAARGAGTPWGLADDLGRAARWLAAREIGWAAPLLDLLAGGDVATGLRAALGAADRVAGAGPGAAWTAGPCDLLWTVPLLAAALPPDSEGGLLVTGGAGRFWLGTTGEARADRPWSDLPGRPSCAVLSIVVDADPGDLPFVSTPITRRGRIASATARSLDDYVTRTYVPASAASRATGAGGSGLDD